MSTREGPSSMPVGGKKDVGWKFCTQVEATSTNKVMCNYCGKTMNGGITRGKEHLMGKTGKVAACAKCPKEVKDELWESYKNKAKENSSAMLSNSRAFDLDSDEDEDEPIVQQKKNSDRAKKGPIDLFLNKPETAAQKRRKEKLRQLNVRESVDKKEVARVHQSIARFWYQAGLSFNMVNLESFEKMIHDIGAFGKHLPKPSFHAIRVPLLNREMEYTNTLLEPKKEEWRMHGCSIMSDGWTDRKQRTIINFLVNSPCGTVFVKSINASGFVKTGEKLFELLDSLVDEIGEEHVVQVITDNGSNYVAAGKMLMEKRRHLYWTPCAAHCIDLMLEDIGKIPFVKNTIRRAISLVGYIYSHTFTLTLLRSYTKKKELLRPAITRFATSFLSLERIHKQRDNLRKMFTCDEWVQNKLSKDAKGREATKTIMMPSFWRHVVFILKVMAPLVRVLRLVDSEKKPAMGYIYEAMEKAKETIMKSFNNNEQRYADIFKIIDDRWNCQLHRPLHAAGHILNPDIFYENKRLEFDREVTNGLYECVERLLPNKEDQDKALDEMVLYTSSEGMFGHEFAVRHRKRLAPG